MIFYDRGLFSLSIELGTVQRSFRRGGSLSCLQLGKNFRFKKRFCGLGADSVKNAVNRDAYTFLAVAGAESAGQFNFIGEVIGINEFLKLIDNCFGTFDVTGAADTYGNFHKLIHSFLVGSFAFRAFGLFLVRFRIEFLVAEVKDDISRNKDDVRPVHPESRVKGMGHELGSDTADISDSNQDREGNAGAFSGSGSVRTNDLHRPGNAE